MSSMPMDRRMKSGVTPADTCSSSRQLAVGGGGGMDGQALGIAHIGQVAEELQAFDEFLAGCRAALDAEAQDRAGALGEVFLGALVIGMALEAGIVDPTDLGMLLEEFSHGLGVLDMPVDAQAEGFEALEGLPAVEGRLAGAIVAQDLDTRLDDEGRQTDAGQIGIDQAVIGRIGRW